MAAFWLWRSGYGVLGGRFVDTLKIRNTMIRKRISIRGMA
jgi:hypothetical protein